MSNLMSGGAMTRTSALRGLKRRLTLRKAGMAASFSTGTSVEERGQAGGGASGQRTGNRRMLIPLSIPHCRGPTTPLQPHSGKHPQIRLALSCIPAQSLLGRTGTRENRCPNGDWGTNVPSSPVSRHG